MYMLTCRLGGGHLDDFVAFIRERVCAYVCECVHQRERERDMKRERKGERETLCISTLCIIRLLVDWEVDYFKFVAFIREYVCVCV